MNTKETDGQRTFRRHRELALLVSQAEALRAATDSGLLLELARRGSATSRQLAEHRGVDPEATDIVLRLLQGKDLLTWDGERFTAGPLLMGEAMELHLSLWSNTSAYLMEGKRGLLDAVRPEVYRKGVALLAEWWADSARLAVDRLLASGMTPPRRILDVGAGGGTWSLPYLERDASARSTGFDLEGVTDRYIEGAKKRGVRDRVDVISGDYTKPLPLSEPYDLIVIGMVLHLEGELVARDVVRRLSQWLSPEGNLVIIDALGDRRPDTSPQSELLDLASYELSLAIRTRFGTPHSQESYEKMIIEAGLELRETCLLSPEYPEFGCCWGTKS